MEPWPASLAGYRWAARFRDTSLLEYCLKRLKGALQWPLVVVAPSRSAEGVGRIASGCGVRVATVPSGRPPQALGQAAAVLKARRMLMLHGLFGLELIPLEFLRELLAEHAAGRSSATVATELPAPLYAVVCEQGALEGLAELPPGVPTPEDPGQVLGIVTAAGRELDEAAVTVRTISFRERCRADGARVPRYIPWTSPEDLRLLERVLDEPETPDPLGRLARLRTLLIERLEAEHRIPAAAVRRIPRSRSARVLYASNPSAYSGAEQCLVTSVRAVKKQGWEAHCLAALEGTFTERLRQAGAVVHCPGRDFARPSAANLILLDRLLEEIRPELIHANATVGVPLLGLARIRGLPLVQWVRVARAEELEEHLVCADRITAVSRFIAGRLCQYMIRSEKVRVVYDAVDTERFSPEARAQREVRGELGIGADEFVVLCGARGDGPGAAGDRGGFRRTAGAGRARRQRAALSAGGCAVAGGADLRPDRGSRPGRDPRPERAQGGGGALLSGSACEDSARSL